MTLLLAASVVGAAALAVLSDPRARSSLTGARSLDSAPSSVPVAVEASRPPRVEESRRAPAAVTVEEFASLDTSAETASEDEPEEPLPPPRFATIRGRVVDADRAPIPGARLVAYTDLGAGAAPDRTVAVNPDGSFEVRDFEIVESLRWVVKAEGFVSNEIARYSVWLVFPGDELTECDDVVLTGGAATVQGTVLGRDGRPVQGARVARYRAGGGCVPPSIDARDSTVTDARGRFVLDGLDAKEVTHVVASFAAGGVASQCVMPVRLEASKACEVVVKLRAPRRLRGVVLTPEGAPARDARVVLRSPLTFRSCLTDAAGRFELDDPNREEGGWLHAVAFENGFFAAASVSSDSLDPRETDVYLSPCQGSVKLRVVDDATGEPVRRCTFAVAYPACLFGGLGAVPVDNAAEIAPGVYRFPFGPTAGDTAGILVSAPGYLTHHGPSLSSDGQARLPEVEVRLVKAETAFRRE